MSGALVVCFVLAVCGIGAARVPSSAPEALCIPVLMPCSTPTPAPTSGTGGGGSGSGLLGGLLGGVTKSAPGGIPVIPLVATPDPNAPVMTLPAAQLGGSSLTFTGLQSVTLVTVPLANGDRTTVIRLAANTITITDFSLDVHPTSTELGLVSNATKMTLSGNVVAYVNSVSAVGPGGAGITLGATTPLPTNETLPSSLVNVTLGLVGVDANSIAFVASHQHFE